MKITLELDEDLARFLGDDDFAPKWEGDGELYIEELWLLAREAVQAQRADT